MYKNSVITNLEFISLFLDQKGKDVMDYDSILRSINAPKWWQAMRNTIRLQIKELPERDLVLAAEKVLEFTANGYKTVIISDIVSTKKLTPKNLIRFYNEAPGDSFEFLKNFGLESSSRKVLTEIALTIKSTSVTEEIALTGKLSNKTMAKLFLEKRMSTYSLGTKKVAQMVDWTKFSSKKLCEVSKYNSIALEEILKTKKLKRKELLDMANYYLRTDCYIVKIIETKKLSGAQMIKMIGNIRISSMVIRTIIETGNLRPKQRLLAEKALKERLSYESFVNSGSGGEGKH